MDEAPETPRRLHYSTLPYFAYALLPEHLQAISRPFGELADKLAADLPRCRETEKALDRLLEAKDCAVRAALAK